MDCDVERIETTVRRKKVYLWRCRRADCRREFPYHAVLALAGCKSDDPPPGHRVRTHEDVVKIVRDKRGRTKLEYLW
jgi:hypothetical protein